MVATARLARGFIQETWLGCYSHLLSPKLAPSAAGPFWYHSDNWRGDTPEEARTRETVQLRQKRIKAFTMNQAAGGTRLYSDKDHVFSLQVFGILEHAADGVKCILEGSVRDRATRIGGTFLFWMCYNKVGS